MVSGVGDVDEMVAWLRRQLDDDERAAHEAAEAAAMTRELPPPPTRKWAHIARHSPTRVLREVAAKRRILELHQPEAYRECNVCFEAIDEGIGRCEKEPYPCQTLRLLASMYADRPGYRDAWRPV